jgi:hypothetical protein
MFCAWYQQPEWWTAIGTFLLVAITGAAVFFGKRAADAAVKVYKLESEPLLVFSESLNPPGRRIEEGLAGPIAIDPAQWYIVDRGPGGEIRLRRDILGELDTASLIPPGAYLEIKNVGRSPALGITISVHLSRYTGEGEAAKNEPSYDNLFTIDAIPAQASYTIGVSNQLRNPVRFWPDPGGKQTIWSDKNRTADTEVKTRPLPVLSLGFVFGPHRPIAQRPRPGGAV